MLHSRLKATPRVLANDSVKQHFELFETREELRAIRTCRLRSSEGAVVQLVSPSSGELVSPMKQYSKVGGRIQDLVGTCKLHWSPFFGLG